MSTPNPQELVCLLPDVAPGVRMQAVALLDAEEIPFRLWPPGMDADSEDLDARQWTAHISVFVPHGAFERAKNLLLHAWGEEVCARYWS